MSERGIIYIMINYKHCALIIHGQIGRNRVIDKVFCVVLRTDTQEFESRDIIMRIGKSP
jgi:hypothetical protein